MSKETINERLLSQLKKNEKALERFTKIYAKGGFTKNEMKILEDYANKIVELNQKLAQRGVATGRSMTPYTDKAFKRAFKQSMVKWALNAKVSLNAVSTYFNVDKSDSPLSLDDVLTVIEIAIEKDPRAKAVMQVVKVVKVVVTAIYKAGLPKQPSFSQLHKQWYDSFDQYARKGDFDKEFDAFVNDYKRERKPPKGDQVDREDFLTMCDDAWKYMPTDTHIQKAFLTKLLKNVPDSWDPDNYSGVAEVNMFGLVDYFRVESGGQIDDVNEPLMKAIKTVWKNEKVINLPIPIKIHVAGVNPGSTVAKFERKSAVPGNVNFKQTSGQEHLFKNFMRTKAYNLPKVSNLSHDK